MKIVKPISQSPVQRSEEEARSYQWLPNNDIARGMRSPHFWAILLLTLLATFNYYVGETPLKAIPPFNASYFTTVHDLHRTLFLIPVMYAALVFRVPGSLVSSFVFLCVVLPRALFVSPYPEALLRPLVFVGFAAVISLLVATQLNLLDKERKARDELSAAYKEVAEAHEWLQNNWDKLAQSERLGSLGQMAASLAHEINNPLAAVHVFSQLLSKQVGNDNISKETILEYLSKMDSALMRGTRLVQNLQDFGRQTPPSLNLININEVVDRALTLTSYLAKPYRVQVFKELDPSLPKLMGDFEQLQHVCANLILNAVQATTEAGRVTVRTSAEDGWLKIEIEDTGCGISPDNMKKLFTPFFTTKPGGEGVGLGLAVAQRIVQLHQGKIEVHSEEGKGTKFTVHLPSNQPVKEASAVG